jgi:hypothetical protein
MRRTSQSAYQPSNKSVLGQSKFNGALEGSALMGSKGFMAQSRNLFLIFQNVKYKGKTLDILLKQTFKRQ